MYTREIPQLQKKSGTALVLSGGATKAFYFHLGVLKVLNPQDISVIVGSSAGAVVGALIASGTTVDTLITSLYQKKVYLPRFDTWVRMLTSSMLFRPKYRDLAKQSVLTSIEGLKFLLSLPLMFNKDIVAEALDRLITSQSHMSGFFDAVALERLFQSILPSNDFTDTDIDLFVVATALDSSHRAVFNGLYDFEDGENHFMTDVPIHKAIRASTAVPGMFDPIKLKGNYYVDGEVKQTLSADIGVNLADRVIISHTYQPLQFNGSGQSVRDLGWINVVKQSTTKVMHERIRVWHQIYEREHPEKELIWIQPDPEDIEFFLSPEFSFRPEIQKKIIKSGEAAALRVLNKV